MKRLKAYTVHDGGDHSVIRFAASNVVARREGANEMSCEFNEVDYCCRAPEFDEYAPGPVPPMVAIKHGWWFECRRCSCEVNHYNDDPVAAGDGVYCSQACEAEDFASERATAAALVALIEVFDSKFSGSTIVCTYAADGKLVPSSQFESGYLYRPYAMVTFNFPGGKNCGRWVFGDEDVTVSPEDVVAFRTWRDGSAALAAPAFKLEQEATCQST